MNLKKLSVAAALSVGIMTISGLAIADQLGAACPVPKAAYEAPCPPPPCPTGAAAPVCPCPTVPPPQVIIPQEPCPTGAACPVAPAPVAQAASPGMQSVYSPVLLPAPVAPNPAGTALYQTPIAGYTPDNSAGANVLERQAYAFPDIGDAGLVIPKGDGLLQIGGDQEAMAISSNCHPGLAVVPSHGPVLNLISKDDPEFAYTTGAAAPISGGCPTGCCPEATGGAAPLNMTNAPLMSGSTYPCPTQYKAKPMERVTQGVEILRCTIPEQNSILQAYYSSPCFTQNGILGAAAPIAPCPAPAAPGFAAPVNPCAPCPTGPGIMPAPIVPVAPAAPAIPLSSAIPTENMVPCATGEADQEANIVPCDQMEPCPTGQAAPVCPKPCPPPPVEPCPPPISEAAPIQPTYVAPAAPIAAPMAAPAPCPTGMALPAGRRIQTSTGIQMQKDVLVPVTVPVTLAEPTGYASPVMSQYPDVTNNMLAGADINKLTAQGILAGYPDRTYKPNVPIMRDEFASAMVSALELENIPAFAQQIFRDVPKNHWAKQDIDKAYNRGLLAGYPNCLFKPDKPVTKAEALSTMGKVLPGNISAADAQKILGCYTDANEIPGWAAMPVAQAVNAGIIKDLPQSNQIQPNQSASRAEIASMLDELRKTLGLEPQPVTTGAATQLQPGVAASTIPTLNLKFNDIISARTSTTGDEIIAHTVDPVCIDGQVFPAGSEVHGEVKEVIRPGFGEPGAIRVAFGKIIYDGEGDNGGRISTALPRDILSAVVIKQDNPNIIGRTLGWPFSWPGKVVGVTGRTVGGAVVIAGNMVENTLTNIGNGNNELGNLELGAAGRSYATAVGELGEGVWYTAKDLASGTIGVVKVTGDELAYIVSPDGDRIAQINPDEVLSVAFAAR